MTNCKSCGEEISKKAKSCPKCGEPVKKTHWFTWLVLFGIIGYAFMPEATEEEIAKDKEMMAKAKERFDNQPKQVAEKGLSLDFSFRKGGFGNIMIADFDIKNDSNISVKDIKVKCEHYASSGTRIDSNSRVIYEVVGASSMKKIKKQNMGLMHSQVEKSSCYIVDFSLTK